MGRNSEMTRKYREQQRVALRRENATKRQNQGFLQSILAFFGIHSLVCSNSNPFDDGALKTTTNFKSSNDYGSELFKCNEWHCAISERNWFKNLYGERKWMQNFYGKRNICRNCEKKVEKEKTLLISGIPDISIYKLINMGSAFYLCILNKLKFNKKDRVKIDSILFAYSMLSRVFPTEIVENIFKYYTIYMVEPTQKKTAFHLSSLDDDNDNADDDEKNLTLLKAIKQILNYHKKFELCKKILGSRLIANIQTCDDILREELRYKELRYKEQMEDEMYGLDPSYYGI